MRYWSLLFLLTAMLCAAVFVYAPFHDGFWLPRNTSTVGREVDRLFQLILWITGIVFIGTQLALAYVIWTGASRPGKPAAYTHGSLKVELLWTIIPAAILVFIAARQLGPWASAKYRGRKPDVPTLAEVTGRQFQWQIRYPGPDAKLHTPDDLLAINDLRLVKNTPVVIDLRTQDVLHSFFLPQMRIKQDAVPGLTIPVWFDCDTAGKYELACAELCGWGHYKMRAVVTVYDTQAELDAYLAGLAKQQAQDKPDDTKATSPAAGGTPAP